MTHILNAILVMVLMMNLFALGTSRIISVIRTVAAQGALLSLIPLLAHRGLSLPVGLAAIAALVIKGIVIPSMMGRALRDTSIKREVEPMIGLLPSISLGALGAVFALLFAGQLPLAEEHTSSLLVPASFATVLTGFIFLTTRFKALSQVLGYLMLENGIFIFGMLLINAMPLMVEMGVLLDLFVGIFVICIIMNKINQSFSSMDTRRLVSLKE